MNGDKKTNERVEKKWDQFYSSIDSNCDNMVAKRKNSIRQCISERKRGTFFSFSFRKTCLSTWYCDWIRAIKQVPMPNSNFLFNFLYMKMLFPNEQQQKCCAANTRIHIDRDVCIGLSSCSVGCHDFAWFGWYYFWCRHRDPISCPKLSGNIPENINEELNYCINDAWFNNNSIQAHICHHCQIMCSLTFCHQTFDSISYTHTHTHTYSTLNSFYEYMRHRISS